MSLFCSSSVMTSYRLASRRVLRDRLGEPRFSGFFDSIVDFFTGKMEEKVSEPLPEPEGPNAEKAKIAEEKFERDVRDVVRKSILNLFEVSFAPDKIRKIEHGGAVSKEVADTIRRKGINLVNFTYDYFKYMMGHALEPNPKQYGLSNEEAADQISLVKKKLGLSEPMPFDPNHVKNLGKHGESINRARKFHSSIATRIAARIAADEDEDEDEAFEESDELDELDDSEVSQDKLEDTESSDFDITNSGTEYSCRIELSMIATFEGSVSREILVKKLQSELKNSIQAGMQSVSNDLGLSSTEVQVRPMVLECAIVDSSEDGMDDFGLTPDDENESTDDQD